MDRPKADLSYVVETLPLGPAFETGQLKCLRCFLVCPDGAIDKSGETLEIDYDYCKGCGVCRRACKPGAISMVKEAEV